MDCGFEKAVEHREVFKIVLSQHLPQIMHPGIDSDTRASNVFCSQQIGNVVSDVTEAALVGCVLLHHFEPVFRRWLLVGDTLIRCFRAQANICKKSASQTDLAQHLVVTSNCICVRKVASAYPRLIGMQEELALRRDEFDQTRDNCGQQLDTTGVAEIRDMANQRAIPIQKNITHGPLAANIAV